MSAADIGIGTRLWRFDYKHRVYRDDRSAPVYAEHFREEEVIGETRTSWVVASVGTPHVGKITAKARDWRHRAVNKQTLRSSGDGFRHAQYFTEQGKADNIFVRGTQYDRSEAVRRCTDVATLKAIDALLAAVAS